MLVLRSDGVGTYNAFALGFRRRRRILISDDLLALLSPDEAHAILLHELGHHELAHLRRRQFVLLGSWIGVPIVLTVCQRASRTASTAAAHRQA